MRATYGINVAKVVNPAYFDKVIRNLSAKNYAKEFYTVVGNDLMAALNRLRQ